MINLVVLDQSKDVRKSLSGYVALDLSVWIPLSDCLDDIVFPFSILEVVSGEEINEVSSVLLARVVEDSVCGVRVKDVVEEVIFAEVDHVLDEGQKLAFSVEVRIVSP